MDSVVKQQPQQQFQKNEIRTYLKQKKLERLQQKQWEEKQRIEDTLNKQRSLIELQKSAQLIRIKSAAAALKDVQNIEMQSVSNSMYRLKMMNEKDHARDDDILDPVQQVESMNKNNMDTKTILDSQHFVRPLSNNTLRNNEWKKLSAKERWQVSPLIDVLLLQQSRGGKVCNTNEYLPHSYEYSSRYENSTTHPRTKSPSLSSLIHEVIHEYSNNPTPSWISAHKGSFQKRLKHPTRISALIATHIMENSTQEVDRDFSGQLC